ncbi:cytochrome P450 [Niveispirillum sp. SYP-B3756]|uniref:cytochrome P450 n=1 Tax=Niveispirillum sp. SYP-B3756 TaxID=2662178 RepID=UPI0012909583|nr:cytochrome P450 [Niveispirillum sp. SYP-B3756]MQP66616.1 cytochrome P450 [Niveispirillum sp. SYP-B3756]
MLAKIKEALMGDLPAFAADPIGFVETRTLGQPAPVPVQLGPKKAVLVATPSAFRHVLVDGRDRYGKGSEQARLRPLLGDGLITASGDRWKAARDAVKSSFGGASLQQGIGMAMGVLCQETAMLAAREGELLDLHALMGELTMKMVVAALFHARMDTQQSAAVYGAGVVAHERLTETMWRAIDLDMLLPTRKHRRFKSAIRTLETHIAAFLSNPCGPLAALTPLQQQFGPAVLRDEAMTMLVAGFETTAMAAAWLVYILAARPDLVDWLRPEAEGASNGGWGLDPARLRDLPRCKAMVQEVLRLYPSTWWVARQALTDDVIDGTSVPKGATILLSPWALHRQPAHWAEPSVFNPQRFIDTVPDKFAFVPFGMGPRTCVGAQLALAELTALAVMMVSAFDLIPESGQVERLRPVGGVTLGPPTRGLKIRISTRKAARIAA